MRNKFTKQAQTALTLAKAAAIDFELGYIGTEHLLLGLLSETEGAAGRVLEEFQVDGKKLVELIDKLVTPAEVGNVTEIEMKPPYSPRTEKVLKSAVAEAQNSGCEKAGTEHLLLAMLRETDCVGTRLLYTMGVNIQKLYAAVLGAMGYDNEAIQEEFQAAKAMQNLGGSPTPALDQYSRDLTQMAAEGKLDPVVGREKEISRLIQILSRRTKNNPCLVGEPGVGKTAIAEGLAQRILAGSVPETIKDKRLVVLDLSGMVAGSKYRGEFATAWPARSRPRRRSTFRPLRARSSTSSARCRTSGRAPRRSRASTRISRPSSGRTTCPTPKCSSACRSSSTT